MGDLALGFESSHRVLREIRSGSWAHQRKKLLDLDRRVIDWKGNELKALGNWVGDGMFKVTGIDDEDEATPSRKPRWWSGIFRKVLSWSSDNSANGANMMLDKRRDCHVYLFERGLLVAHLPTRANGTYTSRRVALARIIPFQDILYHGRGWIEPQGHRKRGQFLRMGAFDLLFFSSSRTDARLVIHWAMNGRREDISLYSEGGFDRWDRNIEHRRRTYRSLVT